MTMDIIGCHKLLEQLYHDTINQNTNLMEILAIIKSSTTTTTNKTSSSLPTIARGLQTKHSKLLSLINQTLKDLQSHPSNEKDIFKSFINEFIIWIDDNTLTLFIKYSNELKYRKLCDSITELIINSPINNLINFITFIHSCQPHLRNPFVLDKLININKKLQEIINNHNNDIYYKKLNNILFSNVKSFNSNISMINRNDNELVSSYFTIDQIIDRTADAALYMDNTNKPIELMLLDLAGTGIYNSLAILSIDYDDDNDDEISRSLMYPPFRINELSLSNTSNSIILKSIDFLSSPTRTTTRTTTTTTTNKENTIIINCDDSELLQIWVLNLSKIFPTQRCNNNNNNNDSSSSSSSNGDKFLIDSHHSSLTKMSGLGINVISDSEHKQILLSQEEEEEEENISTPSISKRNTTPFKELIDNPTPTPFKKDKSSSNDDDINNEMVENSGSNTCNSSITSNEDNNHIKLQSQYDRTVPLIKKTLSYNHQLEDKVGNENENENENEDTNNDNDEKYFQIINRKKVSEEFSQDDNENRPKSSRGEVIAYNETSPLGNESSYEDNDDDNDDEEEEDEGDEDLISTKEIELIEPNVPYHKPLLETNSAPNLMVSSNNISNNNNNNNNTKLYQLSSGSAVDINNFGKNYKPSFIIPNHNNHNPNNNNNNNNNSTNSIISNNKTNKQRKRRSFFDLFKKMSSKSNLVEDTPGFESVILDPSINTITTTTSDVVVVPEKNEIINNTVIKEETEAEEEVEEEEKVSKPTNKSSSSLPSPFALPSSTSTYFFKQYKENGSTSSLNKTRSTTTATTSSSLVSPEPQQPQQPQEEEELIIPQDLKDTINQESTIDFFISQSSSSSPSSSSSSSSFSSSSSSSSPKFLKISKWKHKYGKWEMITISKKIFIKIVINYQLKKCWFIIFKEEFDEKFKEEIDKPILLLDILMNSTKIRKSSPLDLQIFSKNSITNEKILIMIRCNSNDLINDIINNVENALGALSSTTTTSTTSTTSTIGASSGTMNNHNNNNNNNSYGSLNSSKLLNSDNTLASSMMDLNNLSTSHSSTYTSFSSFGVQQTKQPPPTVPPTVPPVPKKSLLLLSSSLSSSLNANEIYNANIINNPNTIYINKINQMQIRLQKFLINSNDYKEEQQQKQLIYNPSSWKILSMYKLNIDQLIDDLTQRSFYYFKLTNDENPEKPEEKEEKEEFRWLISNEMKFVVLEKIGKAGLLVKHNDGYGINHDNNLGEIYMIECRGKKEFKTLYEIF